MKRKLLSLILVFTVALTLASCSSSPEKSQEAASPSTQGSAAEAGASSSPDAAALSFETTDLDGGSVSSSDIFSAHTLTMVNIWGTYCGPCIGEMPGLEVLNGRLAEKDCAIIGVVCDVSGADDSQVIAAAKDIISDTGVSYMNLVPWEGFRSDLPAQFIPTTYFIDSEGRVVGEPVTGARGADEYEALLDAALEAIGR